jgi:NAD+ kinase
MPGRGNDSPQSTSDSNRCSRSRSTAGYANQILAGLIVGRTVIKTKIKSVMIVTKARDHALVQLTRDIAEWLMTAPRHGKPYGVKVHVDAKLEKSKRFDADGLYKDRPIIAEKSLLNYWTPETCVFADTFDIVITVPILQLFMLIEAWW